MANEEKLIQVGRLESIVYAYENEHISIYDVEEMLEHFDIRWLDFLDNLFDDTDEEDLENSLYANAVEYYQELKFFEE